MAKILVDEKEFVNIKNNLKNYIRKYNELKVQYAFLRDQYEKTKNSKALIKEFENNSSTNKSTKFVKNTKSMTEELELKQTTKVIQKKEGISICLTAWQTQDYIEECLDSIENQTYFSDFNDYEILLGIDGCKQTLEKVKSIQYKYRNLRVFIMDKNVGTYVTTNTMMSIAKYDWLLRFDSDDLMFSTMVETIMKEKEDADFIRFNMQNFPKENKLHYNEIVQAEGQMCFSKKIFETYGGFQDWKCGADSELITRLKSKIKFKKINKVLFKRRIHDGGLTSRKETSLDSPLRQQYKDYIANHSKFVNTIKTITSFYTEIQKYEIYVNFTTYPIREKSTVEMLTYFKKQIIKPNKIICWLSTDDYAGKNTPKLLKPFVDSNFIEIRWVKENTYGFKRYEIFKEDTSHIFNIFIDDDILYDVNYIKKMYESARKFPNNPICFCGYAYNYSGLDVKIKDVIVNKESVYNAYLSGFACFPPNTFPKEMFEYENERKKVNPRSDDDWISAWLLKYDKKVILLNSRKTYKWVSVKGTSANGLFNTYNNKRIDGIRNRIANFAKSCVFCNVEDKVKKIWPNFNLEKSCQGQYNIIKKIQIR